jgi:hypothetical protein
VIAVEVAELIAVEAAKVIDVLTRAGSGAERALRTDHNRLR